MSRPPVPLHLLFSMTAVLWAPIALVFGVLAAASVVSGEIAAIAAVVIAAVLALILRPYLGDVLALRAYVDELGRRDDAATPHFVFHSLPLEISGMIGRLHRSWARGREQLEGAAAASTTILDRVPDPLFMLDRGRQIVRANLAARELFGPSIAGRDLSAALRNPDVLAAADQVLFGRDEATVEFTLPVPIERSMLAGINALPAPTADGTVAILRLHDLTEIKRTEQMRADFVANVSHELKTPLTTLLGYIETLRGPARDDPEARERFLSIMNQQAMRMNSLVEDLLSLSRIEMHEHRAPTERVEIADILRTVADVFEIRAGSKGQKIELIVPPEPDAVLGDAIELSQVFENLLENAVRYGRPHSMITLSMCPLPASNGAENSPRRIAIAVTDEGQGIPREHLSRLTERFYRVDPARSRELGGTGLGLAIVKHIVSRHRGELRIESELDKGSTFTVVLPAAQNPAV